MELRISYWEGLVARIAALACALLLGLGPGAQAGAWTVYENCRLVPHPYNDGDSFHVKTEHWEYVFRLYFVDAAESDMSVPERVHEQARYWDIDVTKTLRLARDAAEFAVDFLRDGFTVYTRKEDAMGRSHHKRYFAMLKVKDRFLSEALVDAGLARIYGMPTTLPDGMAADKFVADLKVLERAAKRAGRGGWSRAGLKQDVSPPERLIDRVVTVQRPAAVYSLDERPRLLGVLRQGAEVTVLGEGAGSMVRIHFHANGSERKAQCRLQDLGDPVGEDTK